VEQQQYVCGNCSAHNGYGMGYCYGHDDDCLYFYCRLYGYDSSNGEPRPGADPWPKYGMCRCDSGGNRFTNRRIVELFVDNYSDSDRWNSNRSTHGNNYDHLFPWFRLCGEQDDDRNSSARANHRQCQYMYGSMHDPF
jgi:hypothetical protein